MRKNVYAEQLAELRKAITPEVLAKLTDSDKRELLENIERIRRVMATDDYASYLEYVYSDRWVWGKHLRYLCEILQDFLDTNTGNPYDILALSLPPQHGKTMSITESLPSYFLGQHPYRRVIIAAYNDDLANRFGRRNRDKIKQFGADLFGIQLARSPNSDANFELNNKVGSCLSKGLRSGITGNPAELIIIDDPIKNKEEADSENYRNRVWEEWENAIRTRLAPGAKAVIIQTRWHEDDLVGRLILNEKNITVINLPCEAEENDPLGREIGEPLFPEIGRDKKWLEETKSAFMNGKESGGPSAWYALYQGRPKILEGNMFKEGWFNFWFPREITKPLPYRVRMPDGNMGSKDAIPKPFEFDEIIQSWDCSFKDEITSSFVVGTVWGRRGIDYFLLDMDRERKDISVTISSVERMSKKWPQAKLKLVEDKANGTAVIALLKNKLSGMVPIPANKSKPGRAQATMVAFESGHVFIPHPSVYHWSIDVISEFTSFPNGRHNDIVDSCVHAINRFDQGTANQTRISGKTPIEAAYRWVPPKQRGQQRGKAKGKARVI